MTSGVPSTMYKNRYRRSKDNKFKWYLILAISIVFIVLAVTVIALTIYLTSQDELKDNNKLKSSLISGDEGFGTKQTTTTDKTATTSSFSDQSQTSYTSQQQATTIPTTVPTPKIITLVPATTNAPTSKETAQTTEISTSAQTSSVADLSTQPTTTMVPTTLAPTTNLPTTQTSTTKPSTTQSLTTESPTTQAPTTQSATTKAQTTQSLTTQAQTTKSPTTQAETTQSPTTQAQTTQSPTTQAQTTKSPTTQAPTTQSPTTQAPTTQSPTTQAATTKTSSVAITTSRTVVSSVQSSTQTITESNTSPIISSTDQTTQPIVSDASSTTQFPTTNAQSNIKISGSDISSSSPFLLTCEVSNVPGWIDLQIYRHYGNNQSGLVAQMTAGAIVPTVIVIDDSLTFSANHKTDSLTMVLIAQTFNCNRAGTYSCAVTSANIVIKDKMEIKVANNPPEILVPMTIVEDRTMSLDCIVEFKGTGGDIKWTFSPPGLSDTFYDLSIVPDTKNSSTGCTSKLESKLTFTPGMYDNGSNFRCEVVNQQGYNGTTDLKTTISFLVIDESFCLNKDFTIHNHPYQPCGQIVYCSDIGPIVYEISCPTVGYCYDAVKTQCVPERDLSI